MRPEPLEAGASVKVCRTCNAEKLASEFYSGARRCKRCVAAAQKAARELNPFRRDAYNKSYRDRRRAQAAVRQARMRGAESETVLISVLYERDKGICGICGKKVSKERFPGGWQWMPSHDHIIPVSRGGANTYANSRLVHLNCNSRRGNRDIPDDRHFERVEKADG